MAMARQRTQTDQEPVDVDVIDLEPATDWEPGLAVPATSSDAMGLFGRGQASLSSETNALRRGRLTSAAVMLASAYALLFVWSVLTSEAGLWVISLLLGLRLAIAAAAAAFLIGCPTLASGRVRTVEYALFGSLTILLCVSQYVVNLDFIRRGEAASVLAYEKNGILQLFGLMVIYGMFIPNNASDAARVVLSMAMAPLLSLALLLEQPEAADVVYKLRAAEQVGSNAIYVLLGAGLSIYGAHILHGLRSQLHQAKKFGQYRSAKSGRGGYGRGLPGRAPAAQAALRLKLIRPEARRTRWPWRGSSARSRSAAQLSHPNTIEIFDYGHTEDGTFYYVMEYLPGLSLDDLVQPVRPAAPGAASSTCCGRSAGGSREAHDAGWSTATSSPRTSSSRSGAASTTWPSCSTSAWSS